MNKFLTAVAQVTIHRTNRTSSMKTHTRVSLRTYFFTQLSLPINDAFESSDRTSITRKNGVGLLERGHGLRSCQVAAA